MSFQVPLVGNLFRTKVTELVLNLSSLWYGIILTDRVKHTFSRKFHKRAINLTNIAHAGTKIQLAPVSLECQPNIHFRIWNSGNESVSKHFRDQLNIFIQVLVHLFYSDKCVQSCLINYFDSINTLTCLPKQIYLVTWPRDYRSINNAPMTRLIIQPRIVVLTKRPVLLWEERYTSSVNYCETSCTFMYVATKRNSQRKQKWDSTYLRRSESSLKCLDSFW